MQGSKKALRAGGRSRPLGQVLANDFLDCSIGIRGLYYDVEHERLDLTTSDALPVDHVIGTSLRRHGTGTGGEPTDRGGHDG